MHLHRRPEVFARGTYSMISFIGAIDALLALGRLDARERVQALTGWPPWLALVPLVVVALVGSAAWWGAAFILTRQVQKSRSAKAATAHGFCVAVLTTFAGAFLFEKSGLAARVKEETGWPGMAVSLLTAAVAALVMFLLWRLVFRVASATADGHDPVVALEFLILVTTALTMTLLLHDVVRLMWWSSVLLGAGGSVIVWVPWLHAWRGNRHPQMV